jgi:hypothetical protein
MYDANRKVKEDGVRRRTALEMDATDTARWVDRNVERKRKERVGRAGIYMS